MGIANNVAEIALTIFKCIVSSLLDVIFYVIYRNGHGAVSKVSDPLLQIPASDLADQIRSRKVRAEDVMSSYIARAKEVNPLVNAVIGDKFDEALKSAQELDASLDALTKEEIEKQYSKKEKPFLGVPLSVKGVILWTGMSTSAGLVSRKQCKSDEDASVLKQLMEAGAIPFIHTNIPELAMWIETSNTLYGRTNNPYDLSRSAGGSSGGEGSMIAAGGSVLGMGTDLGGSIRIPCRNNCIFGHKPSNGIVDYSGHWPPFSDDFKDMLVIGPMCRYATDLIPALKVMARPGALSRLQLDSHVEIKNLRVISIPDDSGALGTNLVESEIKNIQRKVAEFLKKEGANVTEQRVKTFKDSYDVWFAKLADCGQRKPWFAKLMAGPSGVQVHPIKELVLKMLGQSEHTAAAVLKGITGTYLPKIDYDEKLKDLVRFQTEMVELLGDNGVLLYPTLPKTVQYHHRLLFEFKNPSYTAVFNALGFPVTQCPLGLGKNGLPLGIQVVAAPNNDHLTLAVANVLEKQFGGWVSPGL